MRVPDFIYVRSWAGFVYVAFIVDVFTRRGPAELSGGQMRRAVAATAAGVAVRLGARQVGSRVS